MHATEKAREIFKTDVKEDAPRFVIYTTQSTARLKYCCDFIFNQVLGVHYRITDSVDDLNQAPEYKVNYSYADIEGVFRIRPHSLLSGDSMLRRSPEPFFRNAQIYLFASAETKAGLAFDLFSATFYMISRHEEWQDFAPDRHGRFEAAQSILYPSGSHLRPVVDQWIMEFNLALRRFYTGLKFPEKKFRIVSTVDVDNLYAYKNKGFLRNIGGMAKDASQLRLGAVAERLSVLSGMRPDPFDVYDQVSDFCDGLDVPLVYFFLMRHGTKYDRTIDVSRGAHQKLIPQLTAKSLIGLHPSYHAAFEGTLLKNEATLLTSITGNPVRFSRQHYLRFDIRHTPDLLLRAGVEVDFTMGYAATPGFRAGTSHPFYFYDFRNEKTGALLFVPFCAMDGAFSVYEKADPRKALVQLLALAAEIKNTGGYFISVFHERSFSNRLYRGYGSLYKNLHRKLRELESQ